MAGATTRRLARIVRTTPGYPRVRRRLVTRLRASATVRRVVRAVFPDLRDERQVSREVRSAVREAVSTEKTATRELRKTVATLRRQHAAELSSLKKEHKERLRRTRADFSRKEDRKRRAKPAVSAGDLVAGLYLGDRPLLVFDVRGVPMGTAETTIEEIAVEQVMGCGYRPMFISDAADSSIWRRYGHLVEHLPPEEGWHGVTPHAEYLAERLESIRADLDARWYLLVGPSGLTDVQRAYLRRCGR